MISGMVAIVGRPNVGKSTIFNRLTKSNKAIIDDQPGVTRDRLYGVVDPVDDDHPGYVVIDTGGFETKDHYFQPFKDNIVWQQTEHAIREADLVVMVFDAKAGLHPHDRELIRLMKSLDKPIISMVNKVDGREQQVNVLEFYELGLDTLMHCSAAHNRGIWELSLAIEEKLAALNPTSQREPDPNSIKVALIGRPNVGKSSILNRLTGEERSLVSDVAGTTRDPINISLRYHNQSYEILDTAGVRRRSKIFDKLESVSVIRSLKAIEDADVVVLVIAADEGLADQDARLAALAVSKYKPLLITVNKWDLHLNKHSNSARDYERAIKLKLKDMAYIPVLFTSCTENQRVAKILDQVEKLASLYHKRITTAKLNDVISQAVREHTPALMRTTNKRVKFFYATQVKTAPPTIVIKCNVAEEIQEAYKRYLANRLRQELDFQNIPIRLLFRGKDEEKAYTPRGKTKDLHSAKKPGVEIRP
ncbi:MAG: ribosome biogenesis GTPase Der [Oligoflexus sp.]